MFTRLRNGRFAAKAGWCGALIAGVFLMGGCAGDSMMSGAAPISRTELDALHSASSGAQKPSFERQGDVLAFKIAWEAPDVVRAPLKFWDGLPHLQAKINGHDVWLVPDTGSQISVLEAETALRCGVRTIPEESAHIRLLGTSGVESALAGIPDRTSIGNWSWSNLPCVVRTHRSPGVPKSFFSRGEPFNILGMAAMHTMCSYVTFDYRRSEIVFGFRQLFLATGGSSSGPMTLDGGLPIVQAACQGRRWPLLLDTGSAAPVELNRALGERLHLHGTALPYRAMQVGLGGEYARPAELSVAGFSDFVFAGRVFPRTIVMIVPDQSKIGDGLLTNFRFTLDFQRKVIWLDPADARTRPVTSL